MTAPESLLEIERDQLSNSVLHLQRSNVELKEAFQADHDPEYKVALEENLVTIAKYKSRIASLEEKILEAKGIIVAQPVALPIGVAFSPPEEQAEQKPTPMIMDSGNIEEEGTWL